MTPAVDPDVKQPKNLNPRTWTFYQTHTSTGDTACSVNGVFSKDFIVSSVSSVFGNLLFIMSFHLPERYVFIMVILVEILHEPFMNVIFSPSV